MGVDEFDSRPKTRQIASTGLEVPFMTKGKYAIEVRKKEVPTPRCRCWHCCRYNAEFRSAYEKEHGDE